MRNLKHHEKKLLRKVDLYSWKSDNNLHEGAVVKKYLLKNREDYMKYNKIVGHVTKLVAKLKQLPQKDETRFALSEQLLQKLYVNMVMFICLEEYSSLLLVH